MSKVKVGDRVRVVIEGEVDLVDDDGWRRISGGRTMFIEGMGGVVSIEVIAPPFVLPTKMYAQVIGSDGYLWTRMVPEPSKLEFVWAGLGTPSVWTSNENLLGDSGLRVISEGVDE
jgi:hypothetical protein